MREIRERSDFKRALKHLSRGTYRNLLVRPDGELWQVVRKLANDEQLAPKYRDHPLHGNLEGSRECHIRPDLLLVYTYEGDYLIILDMLGSHSELFGL
ncbi:MAG: type II toxin-antitoxin system YafQ family toxin [Synergistaceae bacterium]|nr:type II toxin-antitoxin system YafQ family toxin [Synergistaceae bacterium]